MQPRPSGAASRPWPPMLRLSLRVIRRTIGSAHGAVTRRPAHVDRRVLPGAGGAVLAHARRGGADLRGPAARLRRLRHPDPRTPAPRAALPPEARLSAARDGPARVDRRPELQPRVPRPPHGAAVARVGGPAALARRAHPLPAARPRQAAVGGVARPGA